MGVRWTFGKPEPEETRFTTSVNFTVHPKRYWIVVDDGASPCLADPRFDVDVTVRTDRSTLYRTYSDTSHWPSSPLRADRAGRGRADAIIV